MSNIKKAPSGNDTFAGRANPVIGCPLTAALAAIGGKWNLIIVYWLAESPKHFAALRHAMAGISQKVRTQQLRDLVNDGIARGQPKVPIPAPVEYSLTDYGRSLIPLVEDIRLWGRTHMERLNSRNGCVMRDFLLRTDELAQRLPSRVGYPLSRRG
jgi:DNA-binding HxlR family transcriptional regulator